ncbi:sodium channel protein type 9 subunit alpha [Anopheles sinensis]|uniref:Sodium channel protein type 9 subunit alpha n=1 Tax=Anopheles sinensis TaxID=74873 RepID=A0A084VKP1_ANOSI|nr:sodium channel protein type 9 subunit alpha [Anopheles sinensis]
MVSFFPITQAFHPTRPSRSVLVLCRHFQPIRLRQAVKPSSARLAIMRHASIVATNHTPNLMRPPLSGSTGGNTREGEEKEEKTATKRGRPILTASEL